MMLWFKNIQPYRISPEHALTAESSAALFIGEMREFVPAVINVLGGELA